MRDDPQMRTTLDIDDDLLQAARKIAATERTTMGRVISALARRGLATVRPKIRARNGVPLLPRTPGVRALTMKDVNEIRDEER